MISAVSMALSMIVFGSIGIFRRYIPLGSATLAAARGFIGVASILVILLIIRKKPDLAAIRRKAGYLILSGAAIGINWILLFEAYERTTVAVATLCYYMAPVIAILASPLLGERLTLRKLLCAGCATFGMVCVSGVFGGSLGGEDTIGVLFGLGAAVFYASVILLNQKLREVPAYDKTVMQLFFAAVVVLPYALLAEKPSIADLTPFVILMVCIVGVLHTGIAYALYFGAMGKLPAQSAALMGYIDPMVAVILSVTVLKEPLGIAEIIGILCIFGATIAGELPSKSEKKN